MACQDNDFGMELALWSSYGTKNACMQRQSPDVQICRARFVGNRRVKAARRFWVDVMLRALRNHINMTARQKQEQSSDSKARLTRVSFTEVEVKSLTLESRKSKSFLMVYKNCLNLSRRKQTASLKQNLLILRNSFLRHSNTLSAKRRLMVRVA